MSTNFRRSAAPLITTIPKLLSEDLAKENDFIWQENKIDKLLSKPVVASELIGAVDELLGDAQTVSSAIRS